MSWANTSSAVTRTFSADCRTVSATIARNRLMMSVTLRVLNWSMMSVFIAWAAAASVSPSFSINLTRSSKIASAGLSGERVLELEATPPWK